MSPQWISRVSWPESKVYVGLSRKTIENGPGWDDTIPVTPEYEQRLHDYYACSPDWAAVAHQVRAHSAGKG